MSGTAPPVPPVQPPYMAAAVIAPSVTMPPWQKLLLAGCIIGGIVTVGFMFSGKSLPFLHKKAPEERPIEVQMNGPITRLEKPPDAPLRNTGFQPNTGAHPAPKSTFEQEAANADLLAFAPSSPNSGAASGSARPPTKPIADDPDDLPASSQPGAFERSLASPKIVGSRVAELPDPRWLIAQGTVLQCAQQTALDSTLPGAITAILPNDTRGATGDVVLIPKGAKIFGTVQQTVMNGLERLAVLWQNVTWMLYDNNQMPHLYRIGVDSPASSLLGETGLDGDIDHHYVKKIGGILAYSFIQAGIQYGIAKAQSSGRGNTSVNLNSFQSGGNDAAQELLHDWINIPDVMHRNQGLACGLFIVRDLDFRGIYTLRNRQ